MDYLSVIFTVSPASCHGHFYLLGRSLEKLWEEVGLRRGGGGGGGGGGRGGGGGGGPSTHKINSREK